MPLPTHRLLSPALTAPPELRMAISGFIGDRICANESNWLIPAPATNPGMIEIFNQRLNLQDNPVAWAGEFAGKYLISAVQSLRLTSNPALSVVLREFVSQLIATQGTDGSLGLPLQWDLWGQYHVILGLLRWYEQTGDNDALAACERAGDLACARYLNRVTAIATDDLADAEKNQTVAHALTLLYEFTGQDKYLQLALGIESDWASPTGVNSFLDHALSGGEFYTGPRPRWETLHDVQAIVELYFITGQVQATVKRSNRSGGAFAGSIVTPAAVSPREKPRPATPSTRDTSRLAAPSPGWRFRLTCCASRLTPPLPTSWS